jgi:5'-methylthioadenosine phosphorylase/5'-methylthioinosine phosphorylase
MTMFGIIGGSGFTALPGVDVVDERMAETVYGSPSARLLRLRQGEREFLFLPRHGAAHGIPPHAINYRANIQALVDAGATQVVALAAVGGITPRFGPLVLCVPDQLIDYTWGRSHTFFEGGDDGVVHVDCSDPFSPVLRKRLLEAARISGVGLLERACYGVTQGPRLETAAEIRRLERDGCDIVGMTAMPEAALARERGLDYASLAFVVNWAAGKSDGEVGMDEILANLEHCVEPVSTVLRGLVQAD